MAQSSAPAGGNPKKIVWGHGVASRNPHPL